MAAEGQAERSTVERLIADVLAIAQERGILAGVVIVAFTAHPELASALYQPHIGWWGNARIDGLTPERLLNAAANACKSSDAN